MKYTRKQLIQKLADAKAFAADATQEERITILNEALEAAFLCGRWNGTQTEIAVRVTETGVLTLGREFLALKGVAVNGVVRDLASPWYTYLSGTSDPTQFSTRIEDQGDGFAVFKQPDRPAQLRIECAGETGTVEVHGRDASDVDIYSLSGVQHGIKLTFGDTKTGAYFAEVTDVIKPDTAKVAKLYACYSDDTEEVIGLYEPGERVPSYRRYLVPELVGNTDQTAQAVRALVQRRHVDLTNDEDVCVFSNFKAIKALVKSVHWDDESDETRSQVYLDKAIKTLNDELKLMRPPTEVGAVRVRASSSVGSNLHSFR